MPHKDWTRERVASSEFQALVQDQVVAQFPHENARASAIEDPVAGMVSWLDDPGVWEGFDGTRHVRLRTVLEVASRDDLPPNPPLGTEAITADGQRWEYRVFAGAPYWTWPREPQGILAIREFTGNVPLANVVGGARLSAFDIGALYVPAGRSVRVEFTGSISADTTVGSYGFILNFGAPIRRGVIAVPNPGATGAAQGFTIARSGCSAGPGSYDGFVVGGRFAGDGFFHLVADALGEGPAVYTIFDEGERRIG